MRSFSLIVGGNLQIGALWQHIQHLSRPSDNVLTINYFSTGQPLFLGALIFQLPQFAPRTVCRICVVHIKLWSVALCKLPSQTNLIIMPINIWPVVIENRVWFSDRGLSQREMLRIIGVSKGAVSKVLRPCVRPTVLLKGLLEHPSNTFRSKEPNAPLDVMRWGTGFSQCQCPGSGWIWSGEMDAVSLYRRSKDV